MLYPCYNDAMAVRVRLRELAEARGLNMNQTALRAGLNVTVVRRYWYSSSDGKDGGPPLTEVNLAFLEKLADLLGVQPQELLERI
jgi:hypothetical protein